MSISQAQSWLQNHSDGIPALAFNHQKIIDLLENETNFQQVVFYAAADPGFSLALLKKVNINRGENSGKDIVDTPKAAIALLGNKVAHSLLTESEVAENKLVDVHQLFLFQQIINRSLHNEIQVAEWARENGYHNIEQFKASSLLTYSGEALCCVYDFKKYFQYITAGSVKGEEINIFGFTFPELTESLCEKLNLPIIITQAQLAKKNTAQRARFLCYIAELCHQCEHGWYTPAQQETFNQFAEFLQQPVEQVIAKFHQVAVLAAKKSIIPEAWQAASRLVLLQDKVWMPSVVKKSEQIIAKVKETTVADDRKKSDSKATDKTIPVQDDIFTRIKRLLQQENVSKSDILNACMSGLFEDFSMSKVSLLLLSKDKQKLHNRMSRGLAKEDAFSQYQIETDKSGLLNILLKKPQAIWINESSFKKYHKLIPPGLLASIMTNNFFAMSLFIADKPIGIIYADRSACKKALDETAFTQYKQLISLTSKALTFLSKK